MTSDSSSSNGQDSNPNDQTQSTKPGTFYQFLGAHSLLIGIFPFYIPVWLWRNDFSLAAICLFVAISGLTFSLCLIAWELLAKKHHATRLFAISFTLEVLLVAVAACASLFPDSLLLISLAVINGAYNCFFWTTQRCLFIDRATPTTSGRQYGNLQIVVTIALKVGILAGGLLLEHQGMLAVLGVSACLSLASSLWFLRQPAPQLLSAEFNPTTRHEILNCNDQHRSGYIFLIDGLFLFLESHFWTLSLFILSRENFTRFGLTVIALAIGFAVLFYLAKNTVDRFTGENLFRWAVVLYAIGWAIRPLLDMQHSDSAGSEQMDTPYLAVMLIIITFCTSFFRLVFNKRFFDIAAASTRQALSACQKLRHTTGGFRDVQRDGDCCCIHQQPNGFTKRILPCGRTDVAAVPDLPSAFINCSRILGGVKNPASKLKHGISVSYRCLVVGCPR